MRTTFSGISIALRALQTQQISLDVTGHNVANLNNPNYSRQTALHSATRPYPAPMMGYTPSSGQLGTGVEISQINRMRDGFIDLRLRQQLHSKNYWSTMQDGLQQVELFFNEPTENGIHQALDQFWDSLQDLSREPDFKSVREVVVQRAQVLVESITGTRGQLQRLRENMNENIPLKVSEVNSLATRLADLNVQIGKISATGSLPNDLLDTRDAILEKLSTLVDIEVVQDHGNMVGVTIGGASLVHRGTSYALMTTGEASEEMGYKVNEIYWATTGSKVNIKSGEIAALKDLRDNEIQNAMDDLDAWTVEFVKNLNELHGGADTYDMYGNNDDSAKNFFIFEDGQGGEDLSDQIIQFGAMKIKVNDAIVKDVNLIRASSAIERDENGVPVLDEDGNQIVIEGNGDNALKLAQLRFERVMGGHGDSGEQGKVSIGDAFNSMISKLGVGTQKAVKMNQNDTVLENHLQNLKDSVSGVSLDEEMANMIRFQHAYGAAARMMTTVDEALDTIINRLGLVGR